MICAHGYSGNARDFDVLAAALAPRARVACVDFAGRGESSWLASPLEYHFGQLLSDAEALIAQLGVREVDWVGTSMGGLIGMLLAARPASPVRRLVLNDIGAYVPLEGLRSIADGLQAPERFDSLEEVEAHLREARREWGEIDDEQWSRLAVHLSRPHEGGYRLHYDPQIASLMRGVPVASGLLFWGAWHRVQCPVLLVRGERSAVFPASVAATMLESKGSARLAEVAGCGHAPSLMAESQVEIVRTFLDSRTRAWPPRRSSSFPASSRTRRHSPRRSRRSAKPRPAASPT
ncbi:MAG TPA: alpha/beta hydrolase [Usitatibacter sp.]|nr:alpha/beta hydrolase [Usitatibacter sp.]